MKKNVYKRVYYITIWFMNENKWRLENNSDVSLLKKTDFLLEGLQFWISIVSDNLKEILEKNLGENPSNLDRFKSSMSFPRHFYNELRFSTVYMDFVGKTAKERYKKLCAEHLIQEEQIASELEKEKAVYSEQYRADRKKIMSQLNVTT